MPDPSLTTKLRVANVLAGAIAVHACVRPASAEPAAPWLPITGSPALGGFPGGLPSPKVTAWVAAPAGSLDLRVVSGEGGPNCSDHVLSAITVAVDHRAEFGTVLVRGDVDHVDVTVLVDLLQADASSGKLRLVHAARGKGPLDATIQGCSPIGTSSYENPLSRAAPLATAQTCGIAAPVNEVGYAFTIPNLPAPAEVLGTLAIFDGVTGDELDRFEAPKAASPFDAGAVSTAFVLDDPVALSGIGLLVCKDVWPSLDALTTCFVASRTSAGEAMLQISNPSPTTRVDVCVSRSDVDWQSVHRRFSDLGYLGAGALVVPGNRGTRVNFVPVGAPCSADGFSEVVNTQNGFPGYAWTPDKAFFMAYGVVEYPVGLPMNASTDLVKRGEIRSDYVDTTGRTPSTNWDDAGLHAVADYSYGPPEQLDGSVLTSAFNTSPINPALDPPTRIGLYVAKMRALDPRGGFLFGPPILRRATAVPVPLLSDHSYSMLFVPKTGTEPTDLLVCDLTIPAPGRSPAACEGYPLAPL
jgi:hypothetical protein